MTAAPAKLGKLIRLLASDKPGEITAAAEAIGRTLQSSGLDFHALANVVEQQLELPLVPQQTPPSASQPMRSPRAGPLHIGDRVICHEPAGLFRACRCGSSRFTVERGIGPHLAQLRCDACLAGGRWLSRHHMGMAT